jgi:hypothetical protein
VAKITTGGGPSIHAEGLAADAAALAGPAAAGDPEDTVPVPVAAQLAAGVPAAQTVTVADQKAGAPAPVPAAAAAPASSAPPAGTS